MLYNYILSNGHMKPFFVHALSGTSPFKGTDGERFIKSIDVLIASPQKGLGSLE